MVVATTHRLKSKPQIVSRQTLLQKVPDGLDFFLQKSSLPMLKKQFIVTLFCACFVVSACQSTGPKYRDVRSFSEGLAPVQTQGGRWGFINERQEWVITSRFEDTKEFYGGKAAVRQNGKWGFINKRGEWL